MTTLWAYSDSMRTIWVSVPDSFFLAWPLKISIMKLIACCVLSVARAIFASALQMLSPARSSVSVYVIVGWVTYLCLKITSGPLVYFWFLGSKLYGIDSVTMMSLSSRLSWCGFPTFFVLWAWRASWPHSQARQTGGRHNYVAHKYVQRLILSAPPLIFIAGLVGALRVEGYDTIVFICHA